MAMLVIWAAIWGICVYGKEGSAGRLFLNVSEIISGRRMEVLENFPGDRMFARKFNSIDIKM
jgi:hypothetical protein